MKNNMILSAIMWLLLASCEPDAVDKTVSQTPPTATPVDTNFSGRTLMVAQYPISYEVIFSEGDEVTTTVGAKAPAKGSHDFLAFIPGSGMEEATLWVNHESNTSSDLLGDGGGATLIPLKKENGHWKKSGEPAAVDFSPVGGTAKNCLGALTPMGTVLTSEEFIPMSNDELNENGNGIRSIEPLNGYPRYLNYGWMVEVDPVKRVAIRKIWGMGRFMHEGAYCLKDQQTVYLLDDSSPGFFFKYVSKVPGDYSEGQLYVYKQTGATGTWIALPMDRASLNDTRNVAAAKGGTLFIRPEDIEQMKDGSFLLTETGADAADYSTWISRGAKPAEHLAIYSMGSGRYADPFGRILRFDPVTGAISVFIEGGASIKNPALHLASPDNLSINEKTNTLYIHEDLIGTNQGRMPDYAQERFVCEVYSLDLNIAQPTIDDVKLFAVGPNRAETTGPVWSFDYSTYFFNIQHPSPDNAAPFNRSCTVMVTGFQ